MTKQECVNLIKLLKYCYPAFFKTRTKEQFVNFANTTNFDSFQRPAQKRHRVVLGKYI